MSHSFMSYFVKTLQPQSFDSEDDSDDVRDSGVLILQICFIVGVFFEALIAGMIPTIWTSCRESPKILGIANSFACGLFLAISVIHITPEEKENWDNLARNTHIDPDYEGAGPQLNEKIFPLPEVMVFFGYTLILVMDKVLFDTHALFENDKHGDPATVKLETNLRASVEKSQTAPEVQ